MISCEFPVDQKWRLIYKESKDGFKSSDFHSKCDDKPNTLAFIKSLNGNIFEQWYTLPLQMGSNVWR